LHIHRNSVGYRIGRIRDLLGADPFDPWTALQLRAALEARDILGVR
jgi:DNA-binding PucR family transcriptional regulator